MNRSDRILVAAGGAAVILAVAAGWVLLAPVDADPVDPLGAVATVPAGPGLPAQPPGAPGASPGASPAASTPTATTIVVDVQGGVAAPGVRELPAGSRVADAIAAAGGYAADADLAAAAGTINLAQPIVDGAQIRVPRLGEVQVAAASPAASGTAAGGGSSAGGGGLVNLNSATPEELEALPGIGPVTAAKIIDSRAETPFASVDDLRTRKLVGQKTFDGLRELVTVR